MRVAHVTRNTIIKARKHGLPGKVGVVGAREGWLADLENRREHRVDELSWSALLNARVGKLAS